jgi:hypothetical protein
MVDNDYCKRSVQLKYIPFYIDPIEKEIALEMAVNAQLSNIYGEESKIHAGDSIQLPFYGVPKKVYYTREYVQLPNLEEFFYELVKEVRAYRIKKQAYLKLVAYSQYQDLMPLILLDNIPVSDINEFLKIPLNRIEKVEIIDEPYIVNTEKFSGLISVSTTRNDFAGIELNQNSRFFSYNLLSEGHFTMPDYSSLNENRNAYWHNLLYWNPDIELNPSGPKTVSFYTSDSKGEYIVYIRSINAKGKALLYGTCNIVVE